MSLVRHLIAAGFLCTAVAIAAPAFAGGRIADATARSLVREASRRTYGGRGESWKVQLRARGIPKPMDVRGVAFRATPSFGATGAVDPKSGITVRASFGFIDLAKPAKSAERVTFLEPLPPVD